MLVADLLRRAVRKSSRLKNAIKKVTANVDTHIGEIFPFLTRKTTYKGTRLNILVPSINEEHVFGGIATALKLFKELGINMGVDMRIITTDAAPSKKDLMRFEGYKLTFNSIDSEASNQIVPFNNRHKKTITVGKNDIFIATSWWTAYFIQDIIDWQEKSYGIKHRMIYFIQDFEPGFYPWSSRYLLADSTYRSDVSTLAVFNTRLLADYFKEMGYRFNEEYYFEPKLSKTLKEKLLSLDNVRKEKRIIIYGRPSVPRNAFSLIIEALRLWVVDNDDADEWEILSLGEKHPDIEISKGVKVVSYGKLTLEEYAETLASSYAGISLMVSPHPSYPPLEMASFNVTTITNNYSNKDMAYFSNFIRSLSNCNPRTVSDELREITDSYEPNTMIKIDMSNSYYDDEPIFDFIDKIGKQVIESIEVRNK